LLYESATEENKEKERVQAKRKEFKQKLSRKRAESLQYPQQSRGHRMRLRLVGNAVHQAGHDVICLVRGFPVMTSFPVSVGHELKAKTSET
jgi:hypothetical protein